MGFSITDYGPLAIILLLLMGGAGFIVVTWLLAAARQDRRDILDSEGDRGDVDV